MRRAVIETFDLTKKYGEFYAVKNLNLKVYSGEVFGLLGPNGAGKTTTILMLLGLVRPTSGSALVDGFDVTKNPIEVRRRVGFVPENPGLYDNLTAIENLRLTAELNNIPRAEADKRVEGLLERFELKEWADEEVGKLSRGMKQRLSIAVSLVKRPKVLILDEPTAGIDPKGAEEILSLIKSISREDRVTVLMSSHILSHVEKICNRVALMNRGEVVAVGDLDTLSRGEASIEVELEEVSEDLMSVIRGLEGVYKVLRSGGNRLLIKTKNYLSKEVKKRVSEAIVRPGA